jgi:two-component system, chemotaxis family, chemotaxis protein CheY
MLGLAVGFRALVVDDSQAMRRRLVAVLEGLGAAVCDEAEDGAEGLKRFSEAEYDLVLTDLNMPLVDGLKLIHHIRAGERRRDVPIVVVTTEAAEVDRVRAMGLGASAYLLKPVHPARVSSAVRELLGLP